MFEIGDTIGAYEILAPLKSGGMASLFLARRHGASGFSRLVAIKVMLPNLSSNQESVSMFVREAKLGVRINHPNVVHVEELGKHSGHHFMVMEYVHGVSLQQLIEELRVAGRKLSTAAAVAIVARIAEGLYAVHTAKDEEGNALDIVHRDISPQNILLSANGHVKLIDFGVAKTSTAKTVVGGKSIKGKLGYLSPEQATSRDEVDARSDIYSLGILLWELLAAKRLFWEPTEFELIMKVRNPNVNPPSEHNSNVSTALDAVVMAALQKDPQARPQTAKSFRRMLIRAETAAMEVDSAHLSELLMVGSKESVQRKDETFPDEVTQLVASSFYIEDQSDAVSFLTDSLDRGVDNMVSSGAIPTTSFEKPKDRLGTLEKIGADDEDAETRIKGLPQTIPMTNHQLRVADQQEAEPPTEMITDPVGPSMLEAPSTRETLTPTLRTQALNAKRIREMQQKSQVPKYLMTIAVAIAIGISIGFFVSQ